MATRGRPSLQQGLDREVYQVVTTYLQSKNESPLKIRPTTIYDWIKTSNSSLKRRPKKQLADSIERVLAVLQEDSSNDEDDDIGPVDIDGFQDGENAKAPTDIMNKHITSVWAAPSGPATTNGAEGNSSKRIATKAVDERQVKKQKRTVNIDMAPPTYPRLTDVGGSDQIKTQLMELLVLPLLKPQEYALRGLPTSRGVLLHGPPGCGKTFLCRAFAAELGVPFLQIRGPSVVSGMSGESEKQIRDIFTKAKEVAPSIIFIDEIDVIAPKRDSSLSQMDKRIVGQLLVSMDEVALDPDDGKPVIVLAATNRPDAIDPALRRGGRFDDEVNVGVPNETTREAILRTLTRRPKLSDDVDFKSLAKATAGFVAADLESLVSKAGTRSMDLYRKALLAQAAEMEQEMEVDGDVGTIDRTVVRLIRRARNEDMENPPGFENTEITMDSFTSVLPTITPSSKREGFATVPDTTWSDVGALEKVRDELKMAIVEPIKNPQRYERMGISAPTGVLLWGPPGCGKTLLAKAVAAESKANFISVKGPELLNKYVGESERALRQVFTRARSSIPCVIFFDELDALVPHRSSEASEATVRVVNTLLTELDGLSARDGIYLIAATNRPDLIDTAMLRPGRLESLLYVELPKPDERVKILKALLAKTSHDQGLAEVARREEGEGSCKHLSGADLSALLRKACQNALRMDKNRVEMEDMVLAANHVKPSVGDARRYEKLRERFETKMW